MTINFKAPENIVLKPIITVFGVGGAGGNAVNNMLNAKLQGANFVVANTDAQSLEHSICENKIQLGAAITRGLGAGASPEVGGMAAEESANEIRGYLEGSNMVFITAGMGGGTGTGASPIIAKIAKELGILTVGVVTKPFHFEGGQRMKTADKGLKELQQFVDTLIVIPNQNLFRIANERTTFADAFKMADDVLHAGVRGVTDLMIMPGLINLDFADIRTVMSEMGKAMMGTGEASGEDRAVKAAEAAIANPLLDHSSMRGARGVLINITGGVDMTLFEVDTAANRIREEVGDIDANIIFGSTFNPELNGIIRVSVVATGIDADQTIQVKTQSSLQEEVIETQEPQAPELILEEEIPSFDSYTIADSKTSNQQGQHFNPITSTLKVEEQIVTNNKTSLFSKMWNSLKSTDKPSPQLTRDQNRIISSQRISAETDIRDVPAFLRKQNKNSNSDQE
jgi:cell division protein FtsZ